MEILLSFLLMFWGGTEVDTGNADLNMLKEAVQEVRAQQNSETDIELPQDVNIGTIGSSVIRKRQRRRKFAASSQQATRPGEEVNLITFCS